MTTIANHSAETKQAELNLNATMEEYLLPLRTPCVYYDPQFLSESEANEAYEDLLKNTPWEKTAKINRWVTLMELPKDGDNVEGKPAEDDTKEGTGYRYRDAPGASIIGFPPVVHKLKLLAEEWYNSRNPNNKEPVEFNVCLLNYYQDGSQRIGWHSDREELGRTTPIASISLGAKRQFLIRSKTDGVRDRASIGMVNGSVVVMENVCQLKYLHSVPKEGEVVDGRINLTFRCKQEGSEETTAGELEHEKRDHWINSVSTEDGVLDSTAGSWKKKEEEEGNKNGEDGDCNAVGTTMMSDGDGGLVFGDAVQFYDPSLHVEETVVKSVEYVVKTNIGAECYCAAEMEEVLDIERYYLLARPFGIAGYVAVCRKIDADETVSGQEEELQLVRQEMEAALLQLRSAHHVLRYHDHFDLNDVLATLEAEEEVVVAEKESDGALSEEEATTAEKIKSITGVMLYEYYKERLVEQRASIPSLIDLEEGGTFRTSCDRIGSGHGFQGPEVERYVICFVYFSSKYHSITS